MKESLTYKNSGVDIEKADKLVSSFASLAKETHNAAVLPDLGAYAGLFALNLEGMKRPLLAAACDGVGTKLIIAKELNHYEGLGQDLVAMNVNDLLPLAARPLFFLDYIATGKIEPEALESIVRSIANACKESSCALLGGETAEMPGLYAKGDFDLAGFTVGLVDQAQVPKPDTIAEGDVLLALPSTGVHSNGLSLARKALFEVGGLKPTSKVNGLEKSIGLTLLEPTALYVSQVFDFLKNHTFKSAAHITGGGLKGRLEKLKLNHLGLSVNLSAFECPLIFDHIAIYGRINHEEMLKTFNMGLGFVMVVSPETAEAVLGEANNPWLEVGEVSTELGVEFYSEA